MRLVPFQMPGPRGQATTIHHGSGVPAAGLGLDGDHYVRDDSPQGFYTKSAGSWTKQFDFPAGGGSTFTFFVADTDPTGGDGLDEDMWFNRTTKFLFGPKTAGVWPPGTSLQGPAGAQGPQGLPGSGDACLQGAEAAGITPGTGADIRATLQAFLDSNSGGNVGLVAANRPQGGASQFGSLDFRVGNTLYVPLHGTLEGRNAGINADVAGAWAAKRMIPLVAFGFDGVNDGAAAQTGAIARVDGLQINGRRGQTAGNDFTVGMSNAVYTASTGALHAGHSSCHISHICSMRNYYGFEMFKAQYSMFEWLKASNNYADALMDGSVPYGGNLDVPTHRHWNFWDGTFGIIFVPNQTSSHPTSENEVWGFWCKNHKNCVAIVHDPVSTVSADTDGPALYIHGGSTEYNETGKYGENNTKQIIIPRRDETAAYAEFTKDIPRVDFYVERNARLRIGKYAFQSDTNKTASTRGDDLGGGVWEFAADAGPSGIICLLDGNKAVLEVGECEWPWQQVYSVRARNAGAYVKFLGPLIEGGGIFENVKFWPTNVTQSLNAPVNPDNIPIITMSGWGESLFMPPESTIPMIMHSSYTNDEILRPTLVQVAAPHTTAGTTQALIDDPAGSGETVRQVTFAAGSVDALCRTRYLRGGDSYAAQFGVGQQAWALFNVWLYNQEAFAVRVIPYFDWEGNNATLNDYTQFQFSQLNPGLRSHMTPAAVTLWPGQWMRISHIFNAASDQRWNLMRLDHTDVDVKICVKHMALFRTDEMSRNALGRALCDGHWTLRR